MKPVIAGQGTFTRVHKGSSVNIFRLAYCHLIQKDRLWLMNGKRRGVSLPRTQTHPQRRQRSEFVLTVQTPAYTHATCSAVPKKIKIYYTPNH